MPPVLDGLVLTHRRGSVAAVVAAHLAGLGCRPVTTGGSASGHRISIVAVRDRATHLPDALPWRITPLPGHAPAALRRVPPLAGPCSAQFLALNRGKQVVEVDLGSAAGRRATRELVAGADVFVHSWAPGIAGRWDLDAERLCALRPGLVYAWASGWGAALGATISAQWRGIVTKRTSPNHTGVGELPDQVADNKMTAAKSPRDGVIRLPGMCTARWGPDPGSRVS
jgi:hypothetical protein